MDFGSILGGVGAALGGDWGAGLGVLGGLLGGGKPPGNSLMNEFGNMYKQYAPGYLSGMEGAYNQLTGPDAIRSQEAAWNSGTDLASRNAAQSSRIENSNLGGAQSPALDALLTYYRGRDTAMGGVNARNQVLSNQFNMGQQGLSALESGVQGGVQAGNAMNAANASNNSWIQALPYLSQLFGQHDSPSGAWDTGSPAIGGMPVGDLSMLGSMFAGL